MAKRLERLPGDGIGGANLLRTAKRQLLWVCFLTWFAPLAAPLSRKDVDQMIADQVDASCKNPNAGCQTTIVSASRQFKNATAKVRVSLLKTQDQSQRKGSLLYVFGFSEEDNLACREGGKASGALISDGTTGLPITSKERQYLEYLGGVWKLGLDIYVVDWCNKHDWIERNSYALDTVIDKVRDGTLPNASPVAGNDKFILMAHSMGGLIARYTLDKREQNGPPDGVDLFISFDAPQEGAYLPIGIQQAAEFFNEAQELFNDVPGVSLNYSDVAAKLNGADTPAAREMLLVHHDGKDGSGPAPEFLQLFQELDSMGYPHADGLRTVAIANGNGSGKRTAAPVPPLRWEVLKLFDKTFHLQFPPGADKDHVIWSGSLRVREEPVIDMVVSPLTKANVFQRVFRVEVQQPNPTFNGIPVSLVDPDAIAKAVGLPAGIPGASGALQDLTNTIQDLLATFLNPFKYYQRTRTAKAPAGYDAVSSGTSDHYKTLADSLPGGVVSGVADVDTFIPTTSALGLNRDKWPADTNIDQLAESGELEKETPFDQVYYHEKDTPHTSYTASVERWVCREVRNTLRAPSLHSISPDTRPVGAPDFTVTVKGANFTDQQVLVWDNPSTNEVVDLPTRFIDSETLAADISQNLVSKLPPCVGSGCSELDPERVPVTIHLKIVPPETPSCYTDLDFHIVDKRVTVQPATPTANDPIQVKLTGIWRDSCAPHVPLDLGGQKAYTIAGNEITIATTLDPIPDPSAPPGSVSFCLFAIWPYTVPVTIDPLPVGEYEVRYVNQGQTLGVQGFRVLYPKPHIGGFSPSSIAAGQTGDIDVTVLGTGFVDGVSTVHWDGTVHPSKFIDENTLLITIPAAGAATSRDLAITVDNPDPFGSNLSDPAILPISLPLLLQSASVSTIQAGAGDTTVVLTGQSFTNASTVVLTGADGQPQDLPTEFLDSTRLQTVVPAGQFIHPGTLLLQVRDGQAMTGSLKLIVEGALPPAAGPPAITSITNAASFTPGIAPGSFATIFGSSLSGATTAASSLPLPFEMGGVSVTVNGIPAALQYVSPGQVNFQVPFETAAGPAKVALVSQGNAPAEFDVTVEANAFGVFQYNRDGVLDPVIVHADNTLVTPESPAHPGETVVVYGTGAQVNNTPADGAASPSNPAATCAVTPDVLVSTNQAGSVAKTTYCGLTANFVSLIQVDVRLPAARPPGDSWDLVIRFGDGGYVLARIYLADQ